MTLGDYIHTPEDAELADVPYCPECKRECFKGWCRCGWSEEMVETIHVLTANELISYKTTPEKTTK